MSVPTDDSGADETLSEEERRVVDSISNLGSQWRLLVLYDLQNSENRPGDGRDRVLPGLRRAEVTSYGTSLSNPVEMTCTQTSGHLINTRTKSRTTASSVATSTSGIAQSRTGRQRPRAYGDSSDSTTVSHNQHCQRSVNHHRLGIQERFDPSVLEFTRVSDQRETGRTPSRRSRVVGPRVRRVRLAGVERRPRPPRSPAVTRMLAGPTSYQPGIFDIRSRQRGRPLQTTRAKRLRRPNYWPSRWLPTGWKLTRRVLRGGEFVQAPSGTLNGMITADRWRNAFGAHYVPVDPYRKPDGATVRLSGKQRPRAGPTIRLRYAVIRQTIDSGSGTAVPRRRSSLTAQNRRRAVVHQLVGTCGGPHSVC